MWIEFLGYLIRKDEINIAYKDDGKLRIYVNLKKGDLLEFTLESKEDFTRSWIELSKKMIQR